MNKIEIIKKIESMGGFFIGHVNGNSFVEGYLKNTPYIISYGVRLSKAIINEIEDKPTYTYFNHYRSVNFLIDQINLQIVLLLENNNYKGYSIGSSQSIPTSKTSYSGILSHKIGAILSGEGFIGKSGLFVHKKYGSIIRLGTVLTDFATQEKYEILSSKCKSCNECVKSCPAMAINGNEWTFGMERDKLIDVRACSEHMNRSYKYIGRGSVCGICIKSCPFNKF